MALSPDDATVYISGTGDESGRSTITTVAYDAQTGAPRWTAVFAGSRGMARAADMKLSPDGQRVYVVGSTFGPDSVSSIYATVAYEAGTGRELWTATYEGAGDTSAFHGDAARSVAVSPDGSRVYVTGSSDGSGSAHDYATVAYAAVSGEEMWVSRYGGPGESEDIAFKVAVSPNGARVFITGGRNYDFRTDQDYATVAYDASTGEEIWTARYSGPGNGYTFFDSAYQLALSPDGSRVFVTGASAGPSSASYGYGGLDYATVAYSAKDGTEIWVSRYNGPDRADDWAVDVAISPHGTLVFVTGYARGLFSDYATVAYDAITGREIWAALHAMPLDDFASAVVVSPEGSRVYVTGSTTETAFPKWTDFGTIAYDAHTGLELWTARFDGPAGNTLNNGLDYGNDKAAAMALSKDGSMLFVAGRTVPSSRFYSDYATVAYCMPEAIPSSSCFAPSR